MIFILFLFLLFISPSKSEADNKALLIGVGNYPEDSGWSKISSANDMEILSQTLNPSFKVQTLIDGKATYKAIKRAFEELTKNSKSGDTIYVHFSGHGQQIICSSKDEVDYLDEALVPFDAPSTKSDKYSGECHLLDDEFGLFLTKLRRAVGPSGCLIATLDACYSDSMDKGEKAKAKDSVIYRGGEAIFGSNYISMDSLNNIMLHQKNRDNYKLRTSSDLSDAVIISACRSYQKNMEVRINGVGYGSLTYSIVQSLKDENLTARDLNLWTKSVLKYMSIYAFTQDPQIRCTIENYSIDNQVPEEFETQDVKVKKGNKILFLFVGAVTSITILLVWKKRKK